MDARRTFDDRRTRRVSFRLPERRSGFDRRFRASGALGRAHEVAIQALRSSPSLLALLLAGLVALNGADLALTLRALDLGASELNPAIGRLLEVDLALAVFIKTGLGVSVALTIWTLRRYRTVLEALLLLVAILVAVISYQVAGVMAVG